MSLKRKNAGKDNKMCQKCAKKAKSDTTGCAKKAKFSTKVTHQLEKDKNQRCAKSVPK